MDEASEVMATFIDESGDIGIKEKSSPAFGLTAVWFEEEGHVREYMDEVAALKRRLGLPDSFEFHFSQNNERQRESFFKMIQSISFNFVVSLIIKDEKRSTVATKSDVRNLAIKGLVEQLSDLYKVAEGCRDDMASLNESVIYDRCDDPRFEKALSCQMKSLVSDRGPNFRLVRKIRPGDSKSDPRIQLADMVCGSAMRRLDGDDFTWDIIKQKLFYDNFTIDTNAKRSAITADRF